MEPHWKEELEKYFVRFRNGHVRVVPSRIESFIESLLESERKELAEKVKEQVGELTYAIQMESKGNKSYWECKVEAYESLLKTN